MNILGIRRNFPKVDKPHRYLIGLWLLLFPIGVAMGMTSDKKDILGFEAATLFLNQGQYRNAIDQYKEILGSTENPDHKARALLFTGTTLSLYLNHPDEALEVFLEILAKYPDSPSAPDALFNTGILFYEKQEYEKAHAYFKRYLKRYPDGMRALSARIWGDSAFSRVKDVRVGSRSLVKERLPLKRAVLNNASNPDNLMRVILLKDIKRVHITAEKELRVRDVYSGKVLMTQNSPLLFYTSDGKLWINGRPYTQAKFRVQTTGEILAVGGRKYRGDLNVVLENNKITVINRLDLEAYLCGVLPMEMPDDWAKQALMAQAIAARTYALNLKRKMFDKSFDVESTTASQVYGGYDSESDTTNRAVQETRGKVITYQGEPIVAYFHSNSGGYTEDAMNVWQNDIPYLKGVYDAYSVNVPGGDWTYYLAYQTAANRLRRAGYQVGRIKKITPSGLTESGRVLALVIASGADKIRIAINQFRIVMGPDHIKSAKFSMKKTHTGIYFYGKGYGHGVGMSQWGAYNMARAGHSYVDILTHYYMGVRIENWDAN